MNKKAIITDVIKRDSKNNIPILLNFQNGNLKEGISKGAFIVTNNKTTKCNEGVFSINNNIYHGAIRQNVDELTNTYIAVRKDNKVRLIEVDQCCLVHDVHLQPTESLDRFSSKEAATRVLMKTFGGKKSKSYLERTERSKIDLDIIKTQLNKTVDETLIEENVNYVDEKEIIPPFNKDATNIVNLYNFEDILSKQFLNSLEGEAASVKEFETKKLPISSEFIIKELERVKAHKDVQKQLELIKVLIYLDGLLNYIKCKKRTLHGVELSKISDTISHDIIKRFSPKDSTTAIRTAISVDKAICYFIVLTILIQPSFELDAQILTTEICRPKQKIIKSCNMCNVKYQRNSSDIVTFALPSSTSNRKYGSFKRKTL